MIYFAVYLATPILVLFALMALSRRFCSFILDGIRELFAVCGDACRYVWFWPTDYWRAVKYTRNRRHGPESWWVRWSG